MSLHIWCEEHPILSVVLAVIIGDTVLKMTYQIVNRRGPRKGT